MRTALQLLALASPRKALRARNPERSEEAFERQFHSVERVELVKSLPCAACGVVGYSENAHLLGNDGGSRRGPYAEIGPLCGSRFEILGCHPFYDEHRSEFMLVFPEFNPERVAAETEDAWLRHQWANR